jgi:H+-translocating NAD(P) transhydrogenase subunit beta
VGKNLIDLAYLVASILFILGIKGLSSPKTARRGNQMAAVGMLIAVGVTLLYQGMQNYSLIFAGIAVGGVVGTVAARTVTMTAMPQMVALFNGSGGGAAALVSSLEYRHLIDTAGGMDPVSGVSILLGALIGAISFSGSVVAFGKLQGIFTEKAVTYPGQKIVNGLLVLFILGQGAMVLQGTGGDPAFLAFLGAALLLGVLAVIPIGGGDMPVVISLLNSFTGLATAATGFALHNDVLIISGTLVGASGTLLTVLMCKAMNRPITNVLFGAFGAGAPSGKAADGDGGRAAALAGQQARDVSVEDAATILGYAQSVIVVPGYGLAVAQAQHAVRELADLLKQRGVKVLYAIHPVAGRMPGHMNVLLAEANVPYDELKDLDEVNPDFERADVALVVGANDVVNPAARTDTSSPIYGMPILDADKAKHIIIMKRSMKPGFAGIENELFYDPKAMMLFGDAKDSITKLVQTLKSL